MYQIKEWRKDFYRIYDPKDVYMDLIVGDDRALLLDTGWGDEDLVNVLREITDKPLVIVNSHGHVDHVNGNWQFKEQIYIHPDDLELCKTSVMKPPNNVYCTLYEGQNFELGGITLNVIELPGHTRGSVGLYCQQEGVLFVGDAITPFLLLLSPEAAPLSVYCDTLKKARQIDFTVMMQGHCGHEIPKIMLHLYEETAQSASWDTAFPYKPQGNLLPDVEMRVACRKGYTLSDISAPDFASIVLTQEKI